MKTVLQELIEQLEKNAEATKNSAIEIGILRSCKMATELLEKEREQIKNAYKQGVVDEYRDTIDLRTIIEAEEYYNKTYKQ